MRLLLASHILLWWRSSPKRIDPAAHRAIEDAETAFVSIATAWELAIKIGIGRLRLNEPISTAVDEGGFSVLPITIAHTEKLAALPRLQGDPFDRMLVAQAAVEGLTLVTRDRTLASYGVAIIAA